MIGSTVGTHLVALKSKDLRAGKGGAGGFWGERGQLGRHPSSMIYGSIFNFVFDLGIWEAMSCFFEHIEHVHTNSSVPFSAPQSHLFAREEFATQCCSGNVLCWREAGAPGIQAPPHTVCLIRMLPRAS